MSRRRFSPLAGAVTALGFGLLMAFVVAEVAARLMFPHWTEYYNGHFIRSVTVPNQRGVAIGTPGFDGWFAQNNGDFRVRIRINAFGLRNDEPVEAADKRVWVVGDSFTFGWGVEREDSYTAVMGRVAGKPSYNVASPGEDVCGYQSLVARMPSTVKPAAVVVGLTLENDIHEYDCIAAKADSIANPPPPLDQQGGTSGLSTSFISLKLMLTRNSAFYNLAAVAVKRVGGLENLMTGMGLLAKTHQHKASFDPAHRDVAINRTVAELAVLRDMVPAATPFAVLIIPGRTELKDGDEGYRKLREAMVAALAAKGLNPLDPFPAFAGKALTEIHFVHDGHWSPMGHRLVGEVVGQWLMTALPR